MLYNLEGRRNDYLHASRVSMGNLSGVKLKHCLWSTIGRSPNMGGNCPEELDSRLTDC